MDPLKDYVFVFTGNMSLDREEAKSRVLLLGGRATTSVSSKTTHMVAGAEPGPSKMAKAKELKIEIINEDEFINLLNSFKSYMKQEVVVNIEKSDTNTEIITKDDSNPSFIPWTEKYRPAKIDDLIGNKTVFEQLDKFLSGKTDKKAVLISGAPGIGKTSSALLICRINGIYPVEFNASDLRSKKNLKDHISGLLNNTRISNGTTTKRTAIIMDEVDGMTSDRGGIPELVSLIKSTEIPIICICNDKTHPKMRTLSNYCLDLQCRKLDSRTILPRIKQIFLNEIILNSNGDMRYIINTLQYITSKNVTTTLITRGIFDVVAGMFQKKTISEKTDLYFEDYSLVPLFIHENYVKCNFKNFNDLVLSSESISFSDILDSKIHGPEQDWALLPYHAFFSSIYPINSRILQKRIDFPLFLGQTSKKNKNQRILKALAFRMKYNISSNDFRFYLAKYIYSKCIAYLEVGNITECIDLLKNQQISKEDLILIGDVINLDLYKCLSTKTKTAFTKEYKKACKVLPYYSNNQDEYSTDSFDQ